MKIAVACDGLDIAVTAATCSSFACYTAQSGVEAVLSNAASPREAADLYLYRTLMGEEGLSEKSIKEEPLGELDDAFARIELKLVAQSA